MDTRDTEEQGDLRRAAAQLARALGPSTVPDLADQDRRERLADAVREAGWLELRHDGGGGQPLASGVEAAIIADALGAAVADVPFIGPTIAADLARRAAVVPVQGVVVAFTPSLLDGASTTGVAVDVAAASDATDAYVLLPDGGGYRLALVAIAAPSDCADLTRRVGLIDPGATARAVDGARTLTVDDLLEWRALGLALTAIDLVGVMRGVLDVTVGYAAERRQYGVPVGSFQAVQHLLAEAVCLMEGARSIAAYASWAVDGTPPAEALDAGRVAKAYCARAARTVAETAIQVHGGIGNTWECIAHVYLRRALLSSQWFGDDSEQLCRLGEARLGVSHGLS